MNFLFWNCLRWLSTSSIVSIVNKSDSIILFLRPFLPIFFFPPVSFGPFSLFTSLLISICGSSSCYGYCYFPLKILLTYLDNPPFNFPYFTGVLSDRGSYNSSLLNNLPCIYKNMALFKLFLTYSSKY